MRAPGIEGAFSRASVRCCRIGTRIEGRILSRKAGRSE
jgi:hypothetical protein